MAVMVRSWAPGKILLTGEYAVLEGAPALVCAVDRRVRVEIEAARTSTITAHPLGIENQPFSIREGRFSAAPGLAERLGSSARFLPLAAAALGLDDDTLAPVAVRIDSSELFSPGQDGRSVKLGLGSSAAVAAALATALSALPGAPRADTDPAARLADWLPVYREAMGARASGADLAAALTGGFIEYRDSESARPSASVRQWPSGLHWLPIWVGNAASTVDFVERFDRWRIERPRESRRRMTALTECAEAAARAGADAEALLAAASDYGDEIEALDREMGAGIVSAAHRRLRDAARRARVVFKTCGAGGGDLGVALDRDPERLSAFAARVSRVGAVPLHLGLSQEGALARQDACDSGDR